MSANHLTNSISVEQQHCLNELLQKIATKELTQQEKEFCDTNCLLRYLKARDWNVKKAYKLLLNTLQWRHDFKVDSITAEEVKECAKPGHLYQRGFDKEGRAVIVMIPGKEVKRENYEEGVRYLVYTMESAIQNYIFEYRCYTDSSTCNSTFIETLNILNHHYPERLYKCFLIDPPKIFAIIWKTISPFVPEATKQKVKFVKGNENEKRTLFSEYFDLNQLDKRFFGNVEYEYNHEQYWAQKLKPNIIHSPTETVLQQSNEHTLDTKLAESQ